jgi:hypothetical protein
MIHFYEVDGWRPLNLTEKIEAKDAFFFQTTGAFKRMATEYNIGDKARHWVPSGEDDQWEDGDVYPYRRISNNSDGIIRKLVSGRKDPQPLPLP